MTRPQQTTREVLDQALAALVITNNIALVGSAYSVAAIETGYRKTREAEEALRAHLAHPTPSTTGEALVKLIPTTEELGAPQVDPAPIQEQALQRLSHLGQQLQPEEFGTAPTGCAHCQNHLYAGTKCKNCGRVSEPAPSTWSSEGKDQHGNTIEVCVPAPSTAGESNLCTNCADDGKCMKRQAMCNANEAAMPVGELTDEQIFELAGNYDCGTRDENEIWHFNSPREILNFVREVLAAARSQPTTEESLVVAGAQPLREPAAVQAEPRSECSWCETCHPITLANMRMVLCPECGNKRCPKATHHANACTNSNEPGQPGSSWENIKPAAHGITKKGEQ